jgi:hypothetical protein
MNALSGSPYTQNLLLQTLPEARKQDFLHGLEIVRMLLGLEVVRVEAPLEFVYFPVSCLLSVVSLVRDGQTVETMMVGRRGMACIESLMDVTRASSTLVVQISGQAFRMPVSQFSEFLDSGLRAHFAPFAFTWLRTAALTSGCLVFHHSDMRLARWLLVVLDSMMSDEFPLTH